MILFHWQRQISGFHSNWKRSRESLQSVLQLFKKKKSRHHKNWQNNDRNSYRSFLMYKLCLSIVQVVYYLVIKGCPSEHHWDFIGPFWLIFPFVHLMVPKMQAAWISNQPVRELTPDLKRKKRDMLLSRPAQKANATHLLCKGRVSVGQRSLKFFWVQILGMKRCQEKVQKEQPCRGRTLQVREAMSQSKRPLMEY